jgi:hypothetical protein
MLSALDYIFRKRFSFLVIVLQLKTVHVFKNNSWQRAVNLCICKVNITKACLTSPTLIIRSLASSSCFTTGKETHLLYIVWTCYIYSLPKLTSPHMARYQGTKKCAGRFLSPNFRSSNMYLIFVIHGLVGELLEDINYDRNIFVLFNAISETVLTSHDLDTIGSPISTLGLVIFIYFTLVLDIVILEMNGCCQLC